MVKDNNSYDLDGVSYSDRAFKARREYELEFHEKESLKEIKKCIENQTYTHASHVSEHQEYLEDLMEKLKRIISMEDNRGMVNLSLKKEYAKVRKIHNNLSIIYDNF
ncbi:MAG: hypothetical protein MAG795_00937 [Candidatus Woesearchaeota archaeon]|nr:hypothetical protein [Candidatus Woesearchaeota archaeon]